MDDKFRNRRAQLFNFTVNEILLLIIFLLLLLAAYFIIKNHRLTDTVETLNNTNTELVDKNNNFPKINKNLCPKGENCWLIRGPKEYESGDGDYVAVSKVDWNKLLIQATKANAYPDPELTDIDQDCLDKSQPCSLIKKPNKNLCTKGQDCWLIDEPKNNTENTYVLVGKGEYEGLKNNIKDLEKTITTINEGIEKSIDKPLDVEGYGPPPCWIEPGTKEDTDWLFNLYLYSDGIQFRKGYPSWRQEEFQQLPISIDYNKHYNKKEFIEVTAELNNYARSQINRHPKGCRFYVTIYKNKNINDIDMWLSYEKTIENIFLTRTQIREFDE